MGPINLPASARNAAKPLLRHGHVASALARTTSGLLSRLNVAHCVLTGHVVDSGTCPRCVRKALA